MKIYSRIIPVFAAVLITAVFIMSFTVYAEPELDDPTDVISYDDPVDINMEETQVSESAVPIVSPKPFTPNGQAAVIDWATEYDGKEFYTFKTPAGNVFYLIIDHAKGADNVYFLNAVTEQDLLALAEQPDKKNGSTSSIPTAPTPPTEQTDNNGENSTETEVTTPKENSNTGLIVFLLIGIAVAVGLGYYIKVVRPKQQAVIDDEDDDIPDDDGEEMQFEDEPEDFDDYDDE